MQGWHVFYTGYGGEGKRLYFKSCTELLHTPLAVAVPWTLPTAFSKCFPSICAAFPVVLMSLLL